MRILAMCIEAMAERNQLRKWLDDAAVKLAGMEERLVQQKFRIETLEERTSANGVSSPSGEREYVHFSEDTVCKYVREFLQYCTEAGEGKEIKIGELRDWYEYYNNEVAPRVYKWAEHLRSMGNLPTLFKPKTRPSTAEDKNSPSPKAMGLLIDRFNQVEENNGFDVIYKKKGGKGDDKSNIVGFSLKPLPESAKRKVIERTEAKQAKRAKLVKHDSDPSDV